MSGLTTVPSRDIPESLAFLDQVIGLIENTSPESWWEGPTFRSPCGTKHCVLAHIEEAWGMDAMERFESQWSTSYVIGGRVNDRPSDRYPQAHPQDRVLAFLADLRSGAIPDTMLGMEMEFLGEKRPW